MFTALSIRMVCRLMNLAFICLAIWVAMPQQAQAQPCIDTQILVTLTGNPVVCIDPTTPIACATASGGATPYTYTWSVNGGIVPQTDICVFGTSGSAFTIYAVTITDAYGCTGSANYTVTGSPIPFIIFTTQNPTACGASGNGTISADVVGVGVSGMYFYTWDTGVTGSTITNLSSGNYCVTVTDPIMGCTASACASVYLDIPTQAATCGQCNGSIVLSDMGDSVFSIAISGGNPPFEAIFQGVDIIPDLCPGEYELVALDVEGGILCETTFVIENIDLDAVADATFSTSVGTAANLNACTNQAIQFTATGSENLSLLWDFGEPTSANNTAEIATPTHTYVDEGTYTVTLIAQGCYTTDTMQSTITVTEGIAPDITCISLQCVGDTVTYTTAVVCDDYAWTVSGATVLGATDASSITVVWNDVPQGNISLTVGNCGGVVCSNTTTAVVPLLSNTMLIAGPNVVCGGEVALYSLPSYGGVQYNWSIVPPTAGSIVSGLGTPQIAVAWNSGGIDGVVQADLGSLLLACTPTATLPVQVNMPYTIQGEESVCAGEAHTYTASSGLHNWDIIGDGTFIGSNNNTNAVSVLAANTGSYTLSATPANTADYCNYPQTLTADITPQPATPTLSGSTLICPSHAYEYSIIAPNPAYSYHWTITGGTPASGEGASIWITFDANGTYSISVEAALKLSPFCRSQAALLQPSAVSSFNIDGNLQVCAGEKANYTALPLLPDIDYTWSVSPAAAGSVIAGQGSNAIIVQWNNGFAAATLNISACNTNATANIIINTAIPPTLSASGYLCSGSTIGLSTSPTYNQYLWSNGQTTALANIGTGGIYSVTTTDADGCTANSQIDITEYALPDASISASVYPIRCTSNPTDIPIHALVHPDYSYQWYQNAIGIGSDTPTFTHIGDAVLGNTSYYMVATTPQGCEATSNVVTVSQINCSGNCMPDPNDYIGFQAIDPYCNTVSFDNLSNGISYQWDFGDGTGGSTVGNEPITHTYTEAGYYSVVLVGMYPSCPLMTDRTVAIPLEADFAAETTCWGNATIFKDLSRHIVSTNISSWWWDFGDGTTSTDPNPTHNYAVAGTYSVSLTIGNGTCTASTQHEVVINPLPDSDFSIPTSICQYSAVLFAPNDTANISQYDWNFGDGTIVSISTPEHAYDTDGNFVASLTLTDMNGCSNTSSHNIGVLPVGNGIITSDATTACVGDTIMLTAPIGASYSWSDASGGNTLAVTNSGMFDVTVTQANGCSFSPETISLNFTPSPTAAIYPDNTPVVLCPQGSIELSADIGSDYSYAWSNGSNQALQTIQYDSFVAPMSLYVTVTSNSSGCSAVSQPIVLDKAMIPAPTIGPISPIQLCQYESTTLTASHPTLSSFTWNTGETGGSIEVSDEGVYVVWVTDNNGCTNSSSATVLVNNGLDMSVIPTGCYQLCPGETLSVPDNFVAYQWLYEGAPIAGMTSNELPMTQSGDYQLIVYSVWGCADTSDVLSLTLTNCIPCEVTSGFDISQVCNAFTFSPISTGNGTLSAIWDFGDGSAPLNAPNMADITHTYTVAGSYEVCLTSINLAPDNDTCSQTYCQTILSTTADISLSAIVDNADCNAANGTIDLEVTGGTAPYAYLWTDNTTNQDLNNVAAGNYGVTVSDTGGCTATYTATIVTDSLSMPIITCDAISTDSLTFSWLPIANAISYEVTVTIGSLGTNTYTITNNSYTANGLSPETEVTISVVALAPNACMPSATAVQTCNSLPFSCPLLSAPLISCDATTDSSLSVIWSAVGGALGYNVLISIGGVSQGDTVSTSATSYTISGLSPETAVSIEVWAFSTPNCPPSAAGVQICTTSEAPCTNNPLDLSQFISAFCVGDAPIDLSILPAGGTWSGNGIATNGQFDPNSAGTGQHTLSYNFVQTVGGIECAFDTSVVVSVSEVTILSAPPDTTKLPPGLTSISVSIEANSALGDTLVYTWIANDTTILCSGEDCATLTLALTETSTYTVIATDEYGCSDMVQTVVVLPATNELIVPTAFSPNADGRNDLFRIFGTNICQYELQVYDRLGKLVYLASNSTDITQGWDGTQQGNPAELGVYAFYVLATFTDGKQDLLRGNVTLVR